MNHRVEGINFIYISFYITSNNLVSSNFILFVCLMGGIKLCDKLAKQQRQRRGVKLDIVPS